MAKFAPDNDQGLHAYAVDTYSWGRTVTRIEYAESLKDAKEKFGWTRMRNTRVSVRRATPEDVAAHGRPVAKTAGE